MSRFATLIDAPTLARHAGEAGWAIFDCRHQLADVTAGEQAYGKAHLPGARFLHLDRDLSGPVGLCGGRHPLPDPDLFAARLAGLGVSAKTQVVAYDDAGGMIAARLWWLLRWIGHPATAVLDGGIQAWQAAGLPLTVELPAAAVQGDLRAGPVDAWVDAARVLEYMGAGRGQIVDARSPDRYRGENETIDPVGGHIPGARNRFFRDNLQANGCFKPVETLRAEWQALIGDAALHDVIHQCGSGVSACVNLLAMEHAGLSGTRLYAGSWSEWCQDPQRPVATGAA